MNSGNLIVVSLGEFTKQLAKEAIGNQMKDVMGGARSPEAAEPAAGHLGAVLIGQVQAMQNALKEDQELVVRCAVAAETIRITELFSPAAGVLVLTGLDKDKNVSRIVAAASAVQLLCKPTQAPAGAKGARIRFVLPRPKTE